MNEKIICCNCMYGYNEDWIVKAIKDKIVICPKCKDKFIFDSDLNLKEMGLKNE